HLARDLLAHAARVLAGAGHAGGHRVRVRGMPEHELRDRGVAPLREDPAVERLVAGQGHYPLPAHLPARLRLEPRVEVHGQRARHVLRALDVAGHPVERLRDAGEHHPSRGGPDSTQVSLLPPPCEEFTTSDPGRSATRVRPPGTIVTFSPHRMYGRRSTWQPRSSPSTQVGWRLRASVGWAT